MKNINYVTFADNNKNNLSYLSKVVDTLFLSSLQRMFLKEVKKHSR
jgi:hypothetical protein